MLPAFLCGDVILTCVCRRLREQCLRSENMSVARVAHVLLLRPISGNMDVNTLASKRSELIGNTEIVRMRRVIHNKSICVCLRLPVAAITQKRKNGSFDLWPALDISATFIHSDFLILSIFVTLHIHLECSSVIELDLQTTCLYNCMLDIRKLRYLNYHTSWHTAFPEVNMM